MKNRFNFNQSNLRTFTSAYEGEPGTGAEVVTPTATPTPTPTGGIKIDKNSPEFKMILQAELNRVNADTNRRNKELVTQLEQFKQKEGLTEQEKLELQTQIDDLTKTFQTKEEQAKLELDKVQKDLTGKLKNTESERDTWKNRFEQRTLNVEILESANEYKAFNPQQIAAILLPLTKVQEQLGEDGKPNGEFIGMVNFTGKDKDGKPIPLKLSVKEAVKAMVDMPEQYGNLFRSEATSGLSMTTNGGSANGGRMQDIESMSPQEYAKNRERILKNAK